MPFCTQCGAKLEEGAKFCTQCGARLPENTETVFIPPTEEKPAEPQSYSYEPPAAEQSQQPSGYTYDPSAYSAAAAVESKPAKKKGGAIIFLALAALVVIAALIFIIAGRSGGKTPASDDPVLGLYTAQRAEASGVSISIRSMWKNGFSIELRDKGKASINVDGKTGSAKWTLDGESFTVKGSGVDCSGTLSDGVITLEDVMDSGVTLYFIKDGASLPTEASEPPAQASAGADEDTIGLYHADKAEAYGIEIEISTMWEKGFSIDLQEDGKCSVSVNGNNASGSWSQDGEIVSVNVPGFNMDGTLRDGVLSFEDLYGMGVTLFFTKDGSMLPGAKPEQAAETAETTADSWWVGDWYGWWTTAAGGGKFDGVSGRAWEACAKITVSADGTGTIRVWDEENDTILSGSVSFGEGLTPLGRMDAVKGSFLDTQYGENAWYADPGDELCGGFSELMCIVGRFTDPDNEEDWLEYHVYLRPWGTRWEDILDGDISSMIYDDMMPLYYNDWYLPLIEAGEPMPAAFEGIE